MIPSRRERSQKSGKSRRSTGLSLAKKTGHVTESIKECHNMLPEWKKSLLESIRRDRPTAKVRYILPVKTGTTSVCKLLSKYTNNKLLGEWDHTHQRSSDPARINIMTIRHPIPRLESHIRFHSDNCVRAARGGHTKWYPRERHSKEAIDLMRAGAETDEIVKAMYSDSKFLETKTCPWIDQVKMAKGVDVCLKLEEIPEALQILLNLDHVPVIPHKLMSRTKIQNISKPVIDWLHTKKSFRDEIDLWNKWT